MQVKFETVKTLELFKLNSDGTIYFKLQLNSEYWWNCIQVAGINGEMIDLRHPWKVRFIGMPSCHEGEYLGLGTKIFRRIELGLLRRANKDFGFIATVTHFEWPHFLWHRLA